MTAEFIKEVGRRICSYL